MPQLEQLDAEPLVCDVLDPGMVKAAVATAAPEAIVHAAIAIPKRGPTRPGHLSQTNILRDRGTHNLVAAAGEAGVQRLLAESMIFIYGVEGFGEPVGEEQPPACATPTTWASWPAAPAPGRRGASRYGSAS